VRPCDVARKEKQGSEKVLLRDKKAATMFPSRGPISRANSNLGGRNRP